MNKDVHKLNCTECGAGLDVLGGGRVKTHVCSYCGAMLDAQDDYRVIQQFRDMKRPETPFDLGVSGTLWGAEFTVIGTMAWAEFYNGRRWTWVDHQVFSPTHGYAWLTVEDGHVTFARKSRDVPHPAALSEMVIESAEHRPSVRFQGQTFKYYSSGRASPTFIEGEFNYRPDMDDGMRYVSLMGGERMLDIVESRREREYEVSLLPDQGALYASFGVDTARVPRPRGRHPLDALERSPLQLFTRNIFIAAAVLAFLMAIFFSYKGSTLVRTQATSVGEELEVPFRVSDGTALTEVEIWADARNAWAWFEAELTDDEDAPVAAFERGIEYYFGKDWSEGSQSVRTRLRLVPGDYTLYVSMTEAKQDWGKGRVPQVMGVNVREGVANAWWMWALMAGFAVLAFIFLGERMLRHASRWSGSDWSDD